MKIGCLINLVMYGALFAGYYHWVEPILDSPAVWIVPAIFSLLTWMAFGAVYNAFLTMKDRRALQNARDGLLPEHGRWAAVAGRIEPLGDSLIAPFSQQECVICEYEITRDKSTEGNPNNKLVDFSGIYMVPCAIRQGHSRVQLFGFPNLDPIPAQGYEYLNRAKRFVRETEWEDCTGMKALLNVRAMWNTLTEAEDSFRHDWRSIAVKDCPWLSQPMSQSEAEEDPDELFIDHPAEEDEFDSAFDDDAMEEEDGDEEEQFSTFNADGPPIKALSPGNIFYVPRLQEKRINVGDEVVAIGPYDAIRGALVSAAKKDGQMIRIYRDRLPVVQQKIAGSTQRLLLGGIIGFLVIHAALYLGLLAYRSSSDTQQEWRKQLLEAAKSGDEPLAEKILNRGFEIDWPDYDGRTVLMQITDPAMVRFLANHGANLNAQDKRGFTALMDAAHQGRAELVKTLIELGADLNLKNTEYGTTALIIAIGSEQDECVELLRVAGAEDDTVTEKNGEAVLSDDLAFVAVQQYLSAIHAHDKEKVKALSTFSANFDYSSVDWDLWSGGRPTTPELVAGFVRGDDATLTVSGETPKGFHATWVYQLKKIDGKWKIARERWVTKGL